MEENKTNENDLVPDEQQEIKKDSTLKEVISWVLTIGITLAIAFGLRYFVIEPMKVPTGSMLETIQLNDHLYVNKLAYRIGEVKRGDIAVFWFPDEPNVRYVKRVIGIGGDVVEVKEGKVYVNGKLQDESAYIREPMREENFGPYNVPANHYFMMGDNRNNSKDSRYWKNTFVSNELLIGKVALRYYPFSRFGLVK